MSFNNLIGQELLRKTLAGLLKDNRLSHAILIAGPSGSGKQAWGQALAMAILCTESVSGESCTNCISCRQFESKNHPEFFVLEPDGAKIKIDQVRSIRSRFHLAGGKKVCLIKQAEAMTAEASSSLLKILEEPPEGLHFILLSEQPGQLFDTILSRCQRYFLHPLKQEEIIHLLTCNKSMNREKAAILARMSRGVPGRAYELAEDETFDLRREAAENLAISLMSGDESAYHLLDKAHSLADREDLSAFLELLCYAFRDGLMMHYCRDDRLLIDPNRPSLHEIDLEISSLEAAVCLINDTSYELNSTNVNRRLLLEKMLIMIQRRFNQCLK